MHIPPAAAERYMLWILIVSGVTFAKGFWGQK
jgi:hypothetical protein